jgi:hypothetical protein
VPKQAPQLAQKRVRKVLLPAQRPPDPAIAQAKRKPAKAKMRVNLPEKYALKTF